MLDLYYTGFQIIMCTVVDFLSFKIPDTTVQLPQNIVWQSEKGSSAWL